MKKLSAIASRENWTHLYDSAKAEFRPEIDRQWRNYDSRTVVTLGWLFPQFAEILPNLEKGHPVTSLRIGRLIDDLQDVTRPFLHDPLPFPCCALFYLCALVALTRAYSDYGPPSLIPYLKRLVVIARVHEDPENVAMVVAVVRAQTRFDQRE